MKKRERLVAEAYNIAIFCASTQAHQTAISNGITRACSQLRSLNPAFDEKEFREVCTSPF